MQLSTNLTEKGIITFSSPKHEQGIAAYIQVQWGVNNDKQLSKSN